MNRLLMMTALLSLIPAAHAGMKTTCTRDGMVRDIEVVYSGDGQLPCEVQYTKNGVTDIPWSAQYQTGFCEQQAQTLIDKHRNWGWDCASAGNQENMTVSDTATAMPEDTMAVEENSQDDMTETDAMSEAEKMAEPEADMPAAASE